MKNSSRFIVKAIAIAVAFSMMAPVGLTQSNNDEINSIDYHPEVTVKTPGSENQIYNGTISIDWVATDVEEDDASLDIAIEYSPNGGTNWFPIMSGLENNYPPYSWDTIAAGVPDGINYLFKVIATDNKPHTNFKLSYLFSIDNTPDDRWYLQVESMNLGTHLDLDMKPSESMEQGISVYVPAPREIPIRTFASEYVAHCNVDLAGDWVFSIYAKVSSIYVNGSLYASVYADDGLTSRLLFTTDYDDEAVGSYLTYHEFSWVHSVPSSTMIRVGEHVIVEIILHATAGSGPFTHYNYADADIPVNATVSGDYTDTRISDYRFEIIDEVYYDYGENTTDVILDENFTQGIPFGDGWRVIDGGTGGNDSETKTWTTDNPCQRPDPPPIEEPFAIVDAISDDLFPRVMYEELITPILNLSNATFVQFEFDQWFCVYDEANQSIPERFGVTLGDVNVSSSLTGGAWQQVYSNRWSTKLNHVTLNITRWAAGASDVQIRFHFHYFKNQSHYGSLWAVDNVRVTTYISSTILEHKWTINAPSGGDPYEFSLEARRPDNPDYNNFTFAYSTDDVNYADMITIDSPIKIIQTYSLPPGLSGTVYIRVVDTDRTPGKIFLSRIEIDEMFISSFTADANPITHKTYPNADIPVLGNVTGNYTRTYVSDNLYETIDEIEGTEGVVVTLIDEDFPLGIPFSDGWQVENGGQGGGPAKTWNTHNPGGRTPIPGPYYSNITEPFAIVDAEKHGKNMDEQLITPVLDLSTATWAILTFDHWFVGSPASIPPDQKAYGDVDIRSSLTGGSWHNLLRYNETVASVRYGLSITPWAVGATDVEIRFHYYTSAPFGWWIVDKVKIIGLVDYNISLLEHKWTIDVPADEAPYIFSVEARRNESFDHDDFSFSYSTDDINYKHIVTAILPNVVKVYTFSLPPGISGTVYIRVIDTDRTLGNDAISRIEVDEMFISSVIASRLTIGLDHHTTPSYVEPVLTLGSIAHLCIQDAPRGRGTNVTSHTMTTDDTYTVWSIGYDSGWNYISEVPTNWTNTLNAQTARSSTVFTLDPTTPGSGTITAVYNTTLSDTTGPITVTNGILADIVIRDSSGGLGVVVGAYPMTTDDTLTVWAAGYDADGNYIGDVVCDWSTNSTLDPQSADGASQFTFDPSTAGTSGYVTAVIGNFSGSAGLISVGVGAVDHVIILYAPGGTGPEVGDVLMILGQPLTVYSAGFDADNNYVGDVLCNWTTTGTLNLTSATTSSSFTFRPAAAGETGTINATYDATISDETGTITVTEFGIDYIMIEDGLGNEVTTHTMTADDTLTLWAMGYNLTAGAIGPVNANWTTTGTLDLQTATMSQPFTFDPALAPTDGTIEAIYGSLWDTTGTITVNPGSLAFLRIQDAPGGTGTNVTAHTMTTDDSFTVWSVGYDAEGNYIGGVNANWTTTGSLDPQTATGVDTFTFSPTTTGTGNIEADDLAGHIGSTGLITVNAGALSYILIRDGPGGIGNVIGPYPMTIDDTLTVWSAGYDGNGNYIGDVECNWSTNETLDPQSANEINNFVFDPMTAGTSGYIIAVNGTISDSSGLITVGAGALDHIIIRYSPGGTGTEVASVLMTLGEILTVHSAGYDADDNYIGDIPCNWTTTGSLNLTTATTSTSFTFEPATPGENGTIDATFNGTISDGTGLITVTEHGVDLIIIVDDLDQPVNNYWMDTTETLRVWAMGWNISAGPLGPVAADWTTTGTLDLQTATLSPYFIFDPVHAPTRGSIEATFGTVWDSTMTIVVGIGPFAYLSVQDAPGGTGTNVTTHTMTTEETLSVWAIGYDAKGNYIGDMECNWTTTGTLNSQTATGVDTFTFSPTTAGTGFIMAIDLAGYIGLTGQITVNTGAVSYILIRDGPGGAGNVVGAYPMQTGDTLTVWAASYDTGGNYIRDVNCDWTTNCSLDPHNANDANSFTFDPSTEGTSGYIIAVNGTLSDSAGLITVGLGVLDHIMIRDAQGGSGSEVTSVLMILGETLTVYSAGYDAFNNCIGDVPCDWTTTGTLNLTTATTSSSFTFRPAAAGEIGTFIATYNATISDETGTIDVANHGIDLIVIVDDLGQPIHLHRMDTTETLRVWAMGWNIVAGPVSHVPADWTTTGTLDLQTATTSLSFTFDPVHAPTSGSIEASYMTCWDSVPNVFVDPGPLENICIQDTPGGAGTNITTHTMNTGDTFTVWAIGYDAEWNYINNINCDWATTGTLNLQTDTGVKTFTFSPVNPGTGTITADYNATIGDTTGLITVMFPTFDIDITPAAGSDGWILISFPNKIEGDPLSLIVDAVDEGSGLVTWDIVQWYDPSSPSGTEWKTTATFKPPQLNTFNYVNNTHSFWIHITNYGDGNLTIQGDMAAVGEWASIELLAGWNLVGYPFPTAQPMIDTFGILTGLDRPVETYDSADPYRLRTADIFTEDHEPGCGYWVHVAADEILTIQCP